MKKVGLFRNKFSFLGWFNFATLRHYFSNCTIFQVSKSLSTTLSKSRPIRRDVTYKLKLRLKHWRTDKDAFILFNLLIATANYANFIRLRGQFGGRKFYVLVMIFYMFLFMVFFSFHLQDGSLRMFWVIFFIFYYFIVFFCLSELLKNLLFRQTMSAWAPEFTLKSQQSTWNFCLSFEFGENKRMTQDRFREHSPKSRCQSVSRSILGLIK